MLIKKITNNFACKLCFIKKFSTEHLKKISKSNSIQSTFVSEIKNSDKLKLLIRTDGNMNTYLQNAEIYEKEILSLQRQSAKVLQSHLDLDTLHKMYSIKSAETKYDMFILRGFPFKDADSVTQAEQVLLGLAYLLNFKPFTYLTEYRGRLMHHVKPSQEKKIS